MPLNPYQSPESGEEQPTDYDRIGPPRMLLALGTMALSMFGGCSASIVARIAAAPLLPRPPVGACGNQILEEVAGYGLAAGALIGILITLCRRR